MCIVTDHAAPSPLFVKPDPEAERDEVRRVAARFHPAHQTQFEQAFIGRVRNAELQLLEESTWRRLRNTDSLKIAPGDWGAVSAFAERYGRDWRLLRDRMLASHPLDCPILYAHSTELHLVSGNTRLMVVRALEASPHVVLVAEWGPAPMRR